MEHPALGFYRRQAVAHLGREPHLKSHLTALLQYIHGGDYESLCPPVAGCTASRLLLLSAIRRVKITVHCTQYAEQAVLGPSARRKKPCAVSTPRKRAPLAGNPRSTAGAQPRSAAQPSVRSRVAAAFHTGSEAGSAPTWVRDLMTSIGKMRAQPQLPAIPPPTT